jgi:antitoxin CcdA
MKSTMKVLAEKSVITSIVCDVCKKEFNDIFEMQEFVTINKNCGYESIFGDCSIIDIDICQYCFKELLAKYARISEYY